MKIPVPRLIALELTRKCNLRCSHCRADATSEVENCCSEAELSLDEAKRIIDDIVSFCSPILILTGGEPLLCEWIWDIIDYARDNGLRSVIGTNATLIDDVVARRIAESGIKRVSVSIDFPAAVAHDRFRGVRGAFDAAIAGIESLRKAGLEVQINSTITRLNRHELPGLHDLAVELGAKAFHPFLFVPTGRGSDLSNAELTAEECEEVLSWVCQRSKGSPLEVRPTDAPHYQRIVRQNGCCSPSSSKGCLAGTGFAFIGCFGDVQPCGYLGLRLGNVRERPFSRIWAESKVLDDLRHPERMKGKCGVCEYRAVCGGCRARAFASTGDYLVSEPSCKHIPYRKFLDMLQLDFPLVDRPYAALGERMGIPESECYELVRRLSAAGLIRRVGASFDSRAFGWKSTLVAIKVSEGQVDAIAEKISRISAVTHNYSRSGEFDLWFTVIARDRAGIESVLDGVRSLKGVKRLEEFPAVKMYKLAAVFVDKFDRRVTGVGTSGNFERELGMMDMDLVRRIQDDILPFGLEPFEPGDVERMRCWLADGTLRRFGAIVDHRIMGCAVNALTVWQVGDMDIDAVGMSFAGMGFVSHCYSRESKDGWCYSLYAMVHANSHDELSKRIRSMSESAAKVIGREVAREILFTLHEYKKSPMRYAPSPICKSVRLAVR